MKPTHEQLTIIKAVGEHNVVKVDAVAGSGKTSVLRMIAETYKDKNFLYLAYNKAMQLDAAERMPHNVECRTTHSIAYQAIGKHYQHKLKRPEGKYVNVGGTGGEIAKLLHIAPYFEGDELVLSSPAIGMLVRTTVTRFEHSADEAITEKNIPKNDVRVALKLSPVQWEDKRFAHQKTRVFKDVLKHAKTLWKLRKDVNNNVLITHDTYLKLYQLSKPVLMCDVLLVDEAQDANPCFLSIVQQNFNNCGVVFVGDEHQAIYQWRGSTNAMKMFECPSYKLSKSFRYGEAIADIARKVLEGKKDVFGYEQINSAVDEVDTDNSFTILFRTNFALVQEALSLLSVGKKVNLEMDVRDLCNMLLSAKALYQRDMKKVKHDSLVAFETWEDFVKEADYSKDKSAERLIKWVESGQVERILHYLNTHKNTACPDVILTTAHKAKGLEWDNVLLADDFPSPYSNKGEWVGLNETEQNLLYVACTRAKNTLQLNLSAAQMEERSGLRVNVRAVYSAEEWLNNPRAQLPVGEIAAEHFVAACEELNEGLDDDGEWDVAANEEFAGFVQKVTGVNPLSMPTVENLDRDITVLGNMLNR